MQKKFTNVKPSEYKEYCEMLKTILKKPYTEDFMKMFYSELDIVEQEKLKDSIWNFVAGKSYISGIEYGFFEKIAQFISNREKNLSTDVIKN
jgi:hypothetical protein